MMARTTKARESVIFENGNQDLATPHPRCSIVAARFVCVYMFPAKMMAQTTRLLSPPLWLSKESKNRALGCIFQVQVKKRQILGEREREEHKMAVFCIFSVMCVGFNCAASASAELAERPFRFAARSSRGPRRHAPAIVTATRPASDVLCPPLSCFLFLVFKAHG